MIRPPTDETLAAHSRELALLCDDAGVVRWADARARRLLGDVVGRPLASVAAPGSADKVEGLLAAAAGESPAGDAAAWELVLAAAAGGPTPVSFHAAPHDGGVLLVGSLGAPGYHGLLDQMGASMNELSTLHRETERQQRELLARHQEILRLNADLRDSGRGMTALYSELEQTSDSLKLAAESRTRFVASMGHELRTPLSSILGLSKLLLSRIDGELTAEQERQVGFIRRSADDLLEIVNDLLDIAKMDARDLKLRPTEFDVPSLFGTLRGQLRPIVAGDHVRLLFGDAEGLPPLHTDEGKVAQVLRNFVSNALRFTERGEVRVEARAGGDGAVVFSVADTGIGIPPEHQARIFEEFAQVDGPLQQRSKGTGLGLSISTRLADLLGGRIGLESAVGRGSTFTLTIPAVHPDVREYAALAERGKQVEPGRAPVLVVEDDHQALFLYERHLRDSGFQVVPARGVEQARQMLATLRPAAVVLDVMLEGETTWQFLAEMKRDPRTADIPTLVVTVMDRERQARALGADEFFVKPVEREWLLRKLKALSTAQRPVEKVLVIDDDEVARYVVRKLLADTTYRVVEASDGPEGVRVAREERPDVIFLDFVMPTMTAFEVLDELKLDPVTRCIPVIINTSKDLDEQERRRLAEGTVAILTKDKLSREVAITRIRDALVQTVGDQRSPAGR